MIRQLLLNVWLKLAAAIDSWLDPDAAKKAAEFQRDVTATEAKEKQTTAEVATTEEQISADKTTLVILGPKRLELQQQERQTEDEIKNLELSRQQLRQIEGTKFLIDSRRADDLLTEPLPGAGKSERQ